MALPALLLAPSFAAGKAPDTGKTMQPEAGQPLTFREWQRRAEAGAAEAPRALGFFFHMGLFVEQDLDEAARWYRAAAKQGHADAQFDIGFLHRFGLGAPHDLAESARRFRAAAEQGHLRAQMTP